MVRETWRPGTRLNDAGAAGGGAVGGAGAAAGLRDRKDGEREGEGDEDTSEHNHLVCESEELLGELSAKSKRRVRSTAAALLLLHAYISPFILLCICFDAEFHRLIHDASTTMSAADLVSSGARAVLATRPKQPSLVAFSTRLVWDAIRPS